MIVWVCGRLNGYGSWDFLGVYSTDDRAIHACQSDVHFIAPMSMDDTAPDEPTPWPGAYFPKRSGVNGAPGR